MSGKAAAARDIGGDRPARRLRRDPCRHGRKAQPRPRLQQWQQVGAGQEAADHTRSAGGEARKVMRIGPRRVPGSARRRQAPRGGRATADELLHPRRTHVRRPELPVQPEARRKADPPGPGGVRRKLGAGTETCGQSEPHREHHCVLVIPSPARGRSAPTTPAGAAGSACSSPPRPEGARHRADPRRWQPSRRLDSAGPRPDLGDADPARAQREPASAAPSGCV